MTTLLGQQAMSLANNTRKLVASLGLNALDTSSWWSQPQRQLEQKSYTLEEVSWHWEPHDCWMVIYDKVYDLTDFLIEHPGGYDILLEYAGRDATLAFQGVGHSQQALADMDKYLIGELVEEEKMKLREASLH